MTVTEAAAAIGVGISTASYHLRLLEEAGLATRSEHGRERIYAWPRRRLQIVWVADDEGNAVETKATSEPSEKPRCG